MDNKKEIDLEIKLTGREKASAQIKDFSEVSKKAIEGIANALGFDGEGIANVLTMQLDTTVELNEELDKLSEGQKRYNSYIDETTLNITTLAKKYDEAKAAAMYWGNENDVLFKTFNRKQVESKQLDLEHKKELKEIQDLLDVEQKKLEAANNRPTNIKTLASFGVLGYFIDKNQTEAAVKIAENNYKLAVNDFNTVKNRIDEKYRIRQGILDEEERIENEKNANLEADTKEKEAEKQRKIEKAAAAERLRILQAYLARRKQIEQEIANLSKQTAEMEWQNDMKVAQSKKAKADSISQVEEAYALETSLIEQKNADQIKAEEEKYDKLIKRAKKDNVDTKQLLVDKQKHIAEMNQSFDMELEAREQEMQNRIQSIKDEAQRKDEEREARKKEAMQKQKDDLKAMLDLQQSLYDQFYTALKMDMEDVKVTGAGGIINVDETRNNLTEVNAALKEHQQHLKQTHDAKMHYYDIEMAGMDENSKEYLSLLREKNSAMLDFESKNSEVNKQIQANDKQTADLQKQYWTEVDAKLQEHVGQLSEGVKSLMASVNAIMQDGLDEAKEKLTLVSEMHNKVVEDRKASDDKLQELENQATNARGGRSLVIQEQIDREMAKNQQLAQQEKNLAKEKEKAEKEIAKKEKQMKKAEMGQNIMMGIANVALSVTKALAAGPLIGQILAGLAAAAGAVQVAVMTKQFSKMEQGGLLRGKRHTQGGMRIEGTNIEVEGGEYVINRESTNKNLGLIRYINSQRRELKPQHISSFFATPAQALPKVYGSHFATGGELPAINNTINIDNAALMDAIRSMKFEPKVAVTDILRVQDDMNKVQTWAGA